MQKLTQERLEAIRKRSEAASEGPWKVESGEFSGDNWLIADLGECAEGTARYVTTDNVRGSDIDGGSDVDAEFIAHAREDIPALLAEIERLQNDVIALEDLKHDVDSEHLSEIERLRAVIADFADHGTRHDTNPTIGGRIKRFDDAAGWVAYIRSMDDSVRRRAKEALGE